jgi:hypothetical protein
MSWLFGLSPDGGAMGIVGWTIAGLSILLALVLRKLSWTGVAALVALVATVCGLVLDNVMLGLRATSTIGIPFLWTYGSLIAFPLVGVVRFVLALRGPRRADANEVEHDLKT